LFYKKGGVFRHHKKGENKTKMFGNVRFMAEIFQTLKRAKKKVKRINFRNGNNWRGN